MSNRVGAPLLLALMLGAAQARPSLAPVVARPGPGAATPSSLPGASRWAPGPSRGSPAAACRWPSGPAAGTEGYTEYVERFVAVVTRLMTTAGTLRRPDGFGLVGNLLFEAHPLSPEQFAEIMESLPFKDESMGTSIRARLASGYIGIGDFVDTRLGLQDKDAITFLGLSLLRPGLFRDTRRLENRLVHETLHLRYGHDEARVCAEVSRLS